MIYHSVVSATSGASPPSALRESLFLAAGGKESRQVSNTLAIVAFTAVLSSPGRIIRVVATTADELAMGSKASGTTCKEDETCC